MKLTRFFYTVVIFALLFATLALMGGGATLGDEIDELERKLEEKSAEHREAKAGSG